jgi:hypothetical protein
MTCSDTEGTAVPIFLDCQINSFGFLRIIISSENVLNVLQGKVTDVAANFELYDPTPPRIERPASSAQSAAEVLRLSHT